MRASVGPRSKEREGSKNGSSPPGRLRVRCEACQQIPIREAEVGQGLDRLALGDLASEERPKDMGRSFL